MKADIEIYECGSKATTVLGGIEGIITASLIRFEKVQYEFVYFKDAKRYSEWMEECELKFGDKKRITVGYMTQGRMTDPYLECTVCKNKSWNQDMAGHECNIQQPGRKECVGILKVIVNQ